MNTTGTAPALAPQRVIEDPLSHLPCSIVQEFRRGETIYSHAKTLSSICLVIAGKVKVCLQSENREVLVDIYQPDEFFGEAALVGAPQFETAVALERTQIMMWTADEIERLALARPKLAMALVQLLVQRSDDYRCRIESLATANIACRLAQALIRFAKRLGNEIEDGSVQMMPLTHELLAQYVGTSREIITHYLNQFRHQGYLQYSRQGSTLNVVALKNWLNQEHTDRPAKGKREPAIQSSQAAA